MPLTPEERLWLGAQQETLRALTTKASIYAAAVVAYTDDPFIPWWRPIARWRRRRGLAHVTDMQYAVSIDATTTAAAVEAWIAAHNALAGELRGPILRGGPVWP